MRFLPVIVVLLTATACAGVDRSKLDAMPDNALFYVSLPEFAPQAPDYRRQVTNDIVTERMGFRPRPGQGFALFTYVLGPPGTFAPSPADENQAPAALEAAIRSDSLMKGRSLSVETDGVAKNTYGPVHWIRFRTPGYTCAGIGQAFDDRTGLHGFVCAPDTGGATFEAKRIDAATAGIIRRPLKDADAMLASHDG
jgi:hypothetical protein